jgi:hypothetical protein
MVLAKALANCSKDAADGLEPGCGAKELSIKVVFIERDALFRTPLLFAQ